MRRRLRRLRSLIRATAAVWRAERKRLRNQRFVPVERLEQRQMLAGPAHDLMNLTPFRADPRFQSIDGSGTYIAVLDSEFDSNHLEFTAPDLSSRIAFKKDYADNDTDTINRGDSHGTNVAGIAAGRRLGVAPGAKLILMKVFGGSNGSATTTNFVTSISSALSDLLTLQNTAGYQIVSANMSFKHGSILTGTGNDNHQPYGTTLTSLANAHEMLLVGATANDYLTQSTFAGPGVRYPTAHSGVAGVGAVYPSTVAFGASPLTFVPAAPTTFLTGGARDTITYFSNRDTVLLDLLAPGWSITAAGTNKTAFSVNNTSTYTGTSQAAPAVSGVVALLQQLYHNKFNAWMESDPSNQHDVLKLLKDTGANVFDSSPGAYLDPNGIPILIPTTNVNYKRIDVRRAAERILEWNYESGFYAGASTAIEFNQNGEYFGSFSPTTVDQFNKFRIYAGSTTDHFKVQVNRSNDNKNLPPAVVAYTNDALPAVRLSRAAHSAEKLDLTNLSPGSNTLVLINQATPVGTYAGKFSITGAARPDANHNHSANRLRDATSGSPIAASIAADQKAHYFRWYAPTASGSLNVSIPGGSGLVPVVSLYDKSGKVLLGRVEGTNAAGGTMNFSGLTPGGQYVVRIGSKDYSSTGAFRLYAQASARGGGNITLASGALTASQLNALKAGVESLGRFVSRFSTSGEMAKSLPLLGVTQGAASDVSALVDQYVVQPLRAGLASANSVEAVMSLLEDLGVSNDSVELQVPIGSVGARVENGKTIFSFRIDGHRDLDTPLTLTGITNSALSLASETSIPVRSTFAFDLDMAIDQSDALAPADRVSLQFNELKVTSETLTQLIDATANQGLAQGSIVDGTLSMLANVSGTVHPEGSPTRDYLSGAALDGAQIGDVLTTTTTSSLNGNLPLQLQIGDFDKTDAVMQISDANVYDTTAPAATKQNWGDLDLFAGLSAGELLTLIRGLREKVASIGNLPAINTVIPFTDGESVSSLLKLDGLIDSIDHVLSDAEGAASFATGGDLVSRVAAMLDLPFISQNYDPTTQSLAFRIDYSKTLDSTLPFRLSLDTSVLDFTASADLSVSGNVDFGLTFGIDLTPPGNGVTLGERFFLDDGRLDADIALNLTNVGGSAELFDFLGVTLTGGSGTASASIGVDFFGGQRVTLADIGRSIANSGAAVTGANPVPAAIGNLSYTGTGNITLPNISLSGLAFTPTGTPNLKINLPDFKTPSILNVDTSQLGELLNFQDLSFEKLLDAIRQFVTNLKNNAVNSFLDKDIPGTGKSIGDLINFIDRLATAVEELQNGDAGTLQEAAAKIETKLETALGLSSAALTNVLTIVRDATSQKPMVSMQLNANGTSNGSFGFDLDVDSLLGAGSLAGFPALASSLIDASASGTVTYGGTFDLNLGFGVYLETPTSPVPFVKDTSSLTLTAFANANNTLDAELSIGPLAIFVDNGTVKLSEQIGNNNPARFAVGLPPTPGSNGRIPITQLPSIFSNLNSRLTLNAAVSVALPMFGPTISQPLAGVGGGNHIFTAQIASLGGLFAGTSSPTLYSPDITSVLSGFSFTGGIGSLLTGLDVLLGQLSDVAQGELFGLDLPFVGTSLKNSTPSKLIETIRQKIQLAAVVPQSAVSTVRTELINALIAAGISAPTVNYTGYKADGTSQGTNGPVTADTADIRFSIVANKSLTASPTIDFDLGIPGLSLDLKNGANNADPTLNLEVAWAINLSFGVNLADGFYIETSAANEITANAFVSIPGATTLGGELGFLRLSATNDTTTPTTFLGKTFNGSFFGGGFQANLKAPPANNNKITYAQLSSGNFFDTQDVFDYLLTAKAKLDLDMVLETAFQGANAPVLPKLLADFQMLWDFTQTDTTGTPNQNASQLAFNNVRMDLGTFLQRQAGPLITRLYESLEPLRPAITIFNTALPVVNDLGPLRDYVDGQGNNDGKATLRDLAAGFADIPTTALKFLDAADQIDTLYALLSGFTTTSAPALNLGSYNINVVGGVASLVQSSAPANIDTQLAGVAGTVGTNARAIRSSQSAWGGFGEGSLSFPLFDNPFSAVDLLIGKDVALAQVNFPKLEFGFSFEYSFPIYPFIQVDVVAGMSGFADFGVGYDTRGLRQFKDSGYSDFSKLANGFYLRDKKDIGGVLTDVPEMGIRGSLDIFASLNAYFVKVSVGGGIGAEINADLHDPNNDGRLNLDELASLYPYKMFDMYGRVTAALKFKASIGFWPFKKTYKKTIAEVTLVDFNSYTGPAPATLSGGTLTLNTTSEDDTFVLRRTGGNATSDDIEVSGNGATKKYTGVQRIVFNGGDGNDRITFTTEEKDTNNDGVIDERIAITRPATIIGGAGDDKLTGGDGADSIDGGDGDDEIGGNYGNDTILGGLGNDTIESSNGADSILLGDGNDEADGGLGNDTIRGEAGNDTLAGGGDSDCLDGGAGDDELTGDEPSDSLDTVPIGNDTLLGGDGNDEIEAGPGNDSLLGGNNNDTIGAGDGNDTVDGGAGDDCIAGNAGNDSLLGGTDNDLIYGHSGQASDAGTDDDRIFGNAGNDTVLAGLGNDCVEGGLGGDSISGEAGADTLIGGSATGAPVDDSADSLAGGSGIDLLFGDDASVGPSPGFVIALIGGSGNDLLDAGDADDRLFGQGGADQLTGGLGNDSIDAGLGADIVFAQAGNDTVIGSDGDDQIQGYTGNDQLVGGNNNDQILGGAGFDTIFGDAGNDDLYGDADADLIYGGAGNDTAQGGTGFDTIIGGGGLDQLYGFSKNALLDDATPDLLYGGIAVGHPLSINDGSPDGADTIAGQGGNDTIVGEDGNDQVSAGAGNDSVDGGIGNDLLRGDDGDDTLLAQAGDDVAHGGAGNDSILLSTGNDRAYGDAGADTILGDLGSDFIDGGADPDSLLGGDDNDSLLGAAGTDRIFGEAGNDQIEAGTGIGDYLDAGAGDDLVIGSVDGGDDANPADTIAFGDFIFGQAGNDTIRSLGGADTIDAGDGDDSVDAGTNNDRITLGLGNDFLLGGSGADSVDAGTGTDTAYGEAGADTIFGQDGSDLIDGGSEGDCIVGGLGDDDLRAGTGAGNQLFGEAGADILTGSNDGSDLLEGGVGDDQLYGMAGNDTIRGQDGADVIDGGAGDDTIEGGAGADILAGGADHDRIYGHSITGAGDDNAIDTLFGDFGTGTDDIGAGRDQLFGGGGFDVLLGEGNDDFIFDFGSNDTILFGTGDGGTPNNFVPPGATPAPSALPAPSLSQRDATLPGGPIASGRWNEIAGKAAGGTLGQSIGAPSIVIDSLNRRYIAWADTRNGNAEIYVARHDGTAWTQLAGSASFGGVSNTAANSIEPSITLDASGNPLVAWSEGSNIFVARYDGSAWVAMGSSLSAGGISGTNAASSPKIVNTTAGAMVVWLDASTGTTQVYAKRFNGSAWVAPAAGSASLGGVSTSVTDVSDLAVATDGTRVDIAWTQSVGAVTQVMLRELMGTTIVELAGSASGDGASSALYGANSPTLAYLGATLHLAFVAPLDAALPITGILARRYDGAAWLDSNDIASPIADVRSQVFSPQLSVGNGELRLGWLEQRTTFDTIRTVGAATFSASSFASVLPSSAEGFATTAAALSIALDSSGRMITALGEPGGVRAVAENARITRLFTAGAATSVQSILDANDLGAGDAIVVSGSVAGFTVGGDDAGVAIVSDRSNPAIVTGAVSVIAAGVQLAGMTFNSTLTMTGSDVALNANRVVGVTTLRAANVSATGNTFSGTVAIDQASSGVIAGNAFNAGATNIALNITAAFSGIIRGNAIAGSNIGIHLGAAANIGGNDVSGNTTGIRVATVTLGGAGLESNAIHHNTTGILLQTGGAVVRQLISSNTTGISGSGTVGGTSLVDANTLDNNTTGANITGVVQFNRFSRNGVAIVAGALSRILQNQIYDSTGDGIRAIGARVTIAHNTVIVAGRAVDAAAGSSEVEVRSNVLVSSGAHALYVDNTARTGFWSDNNLLFAEPGAHLVHWFVDFDDILDWQQDVARFDLHSQGRTSINPSATRPRFVGIDNFSAASPVGNIRASSPASDLGDSRADVGVTRPRTNLLSNPGFEAGSTTGWSTNGAGSVLTSPLTAWDATRYFTTGAATNGFVEQTVNLTSAGFSTTQLDAQDFAAVFGGRVRIAGATKAIITFLNGSNVAIGSPAEFTGSADSARWELIGGRQRLPSGTRSIRIRIEGAVASTAIDSAFLYVENDALGLDAGFGGGTPTDLGTNSPRIALRSVDLYTDLILDKPTVIRWDTFGDTNERAVKIDLLQDAANGAQFLMTLAANAPDTGSFEFRPLDFGLSAGTSGYRIRISLVGDDIAFDRSTEASTIPETGNSYFVDDANDTNDEYTPAAVGSNRNTGKTANAPKPQLTSVLRIYDTGPGTTVNVDTGSYNQFDRALISGVVGIGDDEGVTIQGPSSAAKIASLNMTSPLTGFDIYDGDAVTLRRLTIANPGIGVFVRNNSVNFSGDNLTILSPTAQGVYLDSTASAATLDRITVNNAGTQGIVSDVYLGQLSNASITGSASEGVRLNAGVGSITGGLFQNNLIGIYNQQAAANGVANITGNRILNNTRNGMVEGSSSTAISFTGNTVSGHTNATYPAISVASTGSSVSGNVVIGNAIGISVARGQVLNNRVEGSTVLGIDATENNVSGNVVIGGPVGIRMRNNANGQQNEVLRNNLVYNVTTTGIELNNLLDGAIVENNTVSVDGGTGLLVTNGGAIVRLKNNIIVVSTGTAITVASNSQTGFVSNYNLFQMTGAGAIGNWQGVARTTLAAWRAASATDVNSFTGDPSFVNAAGGDFHLRSQTGSYKGGSLAPVLDVNGLPVAATISLTADAQHSIAIDRGDPNSLFVNEPAPNGNHVNLGTFGNTGQASLSIATFVKITSPDGGEQWPVGQSFPINWISHNSASTVTIELLKAGSPVLTIASGEANDGNYQWAIPTNLTAGSDYRIRITRADAAGVDTSDSDFVIAPATNIYYVNDAVTSGDVFSAAAGTALGDGLSPATPNLSIKFILDNYDLGPNDVVRVDAGMYATTVDIVIAADDSGVTIEGPDWSSLSAPLATVNRGNPTADTFVFGGANADNITIRNLGLTGGRNAVRLTASADNSFWTVDRVRSSGNATNSDHFQINAFNGDFTLSNSVIVGGTTSGNDGVYTNTARTIVEGNTFNDCSIGVDIASGGSSSIVRNNTFLSPRGFAVDVNYEPTNPTGQIQVLNNTVTNSVASNSGAGLSIRGYALVEGNTVSGFILNGGNATGIVANSRLATIKGNTVTNNRYGIRVAGARAINNIATANLVIGISLESSTAGPSYAIGNVVTSNPNGIYAGSAGRPSIVLNNLLVNNTNAINYVSAPTVEFSYIANNTIVQSGGRGIYSNSSARNASIRSNIFSMNGGTAFEATTGATTSILSDFNLYHLSGGANLGVWQGVTFADLIAWQNTLLIDADSLAGDPLFTNAGAGDYTLQTGSPAIDGGDPNAAFMGETQSGGRVDIGAYGNTQLANTSPPRLVQMINPNGSERFVTGSSQNVLVRGFGLANQDVVAAIDVGGDGVSQWLPDKADYAVFSAPWHLHQSTTNAINFAGAVNPAPAAVYQTWSNTVSASALHYSLPVADGAYTLRLHFIENQYSAAGQRVMDISVNGALTVDNFDIIGSGVALRQVKILDLPVTATGGNGLTIDLTDVVSDAILSAIEVVRTNAGGVVSPTVSVGLTCDNSTYAPFAGNVPLDRFGRATLPWTPSLATNLGRFKVTSDNFALADTSDSTFIVQPTTNTYYINDSVLDANDVYTTAVGNDANTGTSPDSPLQSLSVLLSLYDLQPGDTVYVDAGTYNLTDRIVIRNEDSGATIRGAGMNKTILNRGLSTAEVFVLANADNVTLSDLAVTGGSYAINLYSGSDSDNVTLERIRAFANQNAGIYIVDSNDGAIVRDCVAYGIPGGVSTDNQSNGIYSSGTGAQILNNTAYNNSTGITADAGGMVSGNTAYGQTTGIALGNGSIADGNTVYSNTSIGINASSLATIRNNTLTGNTTGIQLNGFSASLAENNTLTGGTTGISAASGTVRGNTVSGTSSVGIAFVHTNLTDNTIFNTPTGIRQTGASLGFVVSGNLVYGTTTAGLTIDGGHSNAYDVLRYYNNTLIGTGDAIRINAGDQIVLRDNLLMTTGGTGYGINVAPTVHYNISSDYNLFSVASGKLVRWAGIDYADMVTLRGQLLIEKHSIVANPQFVNAAAGNYAVLATSPTIDAGDPNMAYGLEPAPNGGRANIGHLGNTALANASSSRSVQVASPDGGEKFEVGQTITIRYGSNDTNAGASSVIDHRDIALARTPAGYWALDETAGTLAADLTGNGRTGTYSGSVALNDSGVWSNSAAPNFTGGVVSVANHASLQTASMTVGGWIYPDASIGDFAGIMMKTANAAPGAWTTGYGLYYNNGRVTFYSNAVSTSTISAALPLGQWTHVIATVTASEGIRLYINGALAAYDANASATGSSSAALSIGGGAGSSPFKGKLDEMAAYGSVLSADDIAALYASSIRLMSNRTVSLDLMREGNPTPVASIATGLGLNGSYNWTLPLDLTQDVGYRIRATYSDGTNTAVDVSNAPFVVTNGGTNYYVNDNIFAGDLYATAAGNDGNTGKSPDRPMASLQALLDAYDLDAGDTIYLDAGNYTLPINVSMFANDNGVSIVGAGRDLTILNRGMTASTGNMYGFEFEGATGVRLAKLSVTGAYYGVFGSASFNTNGLTIEDAAVFANQSYGLLIQSGANVTVQRSILYGIPGGSTLDNQSNGVDIAGPNATVSDSEVYDHPSSGINILSDGATVTGNRVYRNSTGMRVQRAGSGSGTVSRNEVFNNATMGIASGVGITLSQNRVYGQTATNAVGIGIASSGAPDLIDNEIFGNYDGVNVSFNSATIRGNRVYANAHYGLNLGAASLMSGNVIYSNSIGLNVNNGGSSGNISSNLFYGNTNFAVVTTGISNGGGMLFTGNTIYQDVGDAIRLTSTSTGARLYGNIIWVNSGHAIYVDATSQTGFVSDGNLFYTPAAGLVGFWGGTDRATLAAWQAASAKDANSITGDPAFVDIDGADNLLGFVGGVDRGRDDNFHLRANSPAIDHGSSVQNSIDANGEVRADDPVRPNAGTSMLVPTVLANSHFALTGTALNFRFDDATTTYTLPFAFPFFGSSYTQVSLNSNGRLSFGGFLNAGSGNNSFDGLLAFPSIAALWDDIRTDGVAADNIFADTSIANQVTIRFNATNKADGSDVNFSVTLFNTGEIEFNYGAGNTNLTPTIGLSGGFNRPLYVLAPYNGQANLTNANTVRFNLASSFDDVGAFEFLGRSDDAIRPVVVGTTPTAIHGQGAASGSIDSIIVNLSEAVDALDARSLTIYELRGAGLDNAFGTADDVLYVLNPTYTSLSTSIALGIQQGALPNGLFRLTIKGSPAGNSGLHDLAGNVLDGTGAGGGDYTRTFSVVGDNIAPTLTGSFVFNAASPHIELQFSEDIGNSLTTADFVLRNLTTGAIIPSAQIAVSYSPATHLATITYLGTANHVLPDGRYSLTLAAGSVSDSAGNVLVSPFVLNFTSLGGDTNGNGVVDFDDLLVIAQNYGQSGRTYSQGDLNYDGVVNFDDLLIMAQHYGSALSQTAPRTAPAAISRGGRLPRVAGVPTIDVIARPIIDKGERLSVKTR